MRRSHRPVLLLAVLATAALGAAPTIAPPAETAGPSVYDADADGVQDTAATTPAPVYAEWEWAPANGAPIHPGTQTVTDGAQCTADFVFVRTEVVDGVEYLVDVLLGTAAHCISDASGANECEDEALPIGTTTEVDGATQPAAAAYNATLSMQRVGEDDPDTCFHNDVGMIRLAFADWSRVNPSVPDFGGPVGVNTDGSPQGEDIYAWGNSSARLGVEETSPKRGVSLGDTAGGWNHQVYMVTPGIPGDSGSGLLDAEGNALGILSTIALAPVTGSNNADDVGRALAWAREHEPAMAGLRLEPGTEPFDPSGYPFLP